MSIPGGGFTAKVLILRLRFATGGIALVALGALLAACGSSNARAPNTAGANIVGVVAAENFYGDLARQLGGSHVNVTSFINDPNADPHEYESSSGDAKAIANARLVVENGVGYDSFMDKLLAASPNAGRLTINVGDLLGRRAGANAHVWYDIDWMAQVADTLTATLQRLDPPNRSEFAANNQRFKTSLQPIRDEISALKGKFAGTHLTQTEPVFGYMGAALGLQIDDGEFQHAIEEGTDPSPQAVAQIEAEIKRREVKVVLYNSQTVSPITDTVKSLAKQQGVPVVGVSETEPKGMRYQQWMLSQLTALQTALGG